MGSPTMYSFAMLTFPFRLSPRLLRDTPTCCILLGRPNWLRRLFVYLCVIYITGGTRDIVSMINVFNICAW